MGCGIVGITKKLVRFWPFAVAKRPISPRIADVDRRRKAVVAVATSAIVFLTFHIALIGVSEFSLFVRDPLYADKELKLKRLESSLPPGSPMVLFLGSSRTGNGFDAGQAQATLTANSGHPVGAFNWGIPASGQVNNLLHLRRILRDGHRPSHLLLEVFPASFATLPGEAATYEVRFTEGANFEWSELNWIGEYGFPTERLRTERQSVLIAPWSALRFRIMGRIRPTMIPYYLRYDWSRSPDSNGWCPLLQEDVGEEQRVAGIKRTDGEFRDCLANMTFNEAAVRAFRETLTTARKEGISVALVRMPEGTNLRNLSPPLMAAKFDRFLDEIAAEYGCKIIDSRTWMSDDSFMDDSHLLRKSAVAYTERLVGESIEPFLKTTCGGSR
jgi:hypothetical protein